MAGTGVIEAGRQSAEGAEAAGGSEAFLTRIAVTGATGFVGRAVVRELIARGHKAICLVRDQQRFRSACAELPSDRYELVSGDLSSDAALGQVCEGAEGAIHLVGIIAERRLLGQTFERIHVEATRRVVGACKRSGVRRFVHMSALGARLGGKSAYQRTKWGGETIVRESGLDWTIFRPSIIHGPEGEFMRMMKLFVCDAVVPALGFLPMPFPVIPYFGDGQGRVQPVDVRDVARCFASALRNGETIGKSFDLGGPEAMSWKELYRICRELIPGAKGWKPMLGQPVWAAKLMARTIMKLPILPPMLRFNEGQVEMSQEDSVCEIGPVERTFGMKLRDFREELRAYARLIA